MKHKTQIVKGNEEELLFEGYSEGSVRRVEDRRIIEVTNSLSVSLDNLLVDFECCLNPQSRDRFISSLYLEPKEIEHIALIISSNSNYRLYDSTIGVYLKKLIENSYRKGHNDFNLYFPDGLTINKFGQQLMGELSNPIKITINGDLGDSSFYNSSNLFVLINGNVGVDVAGSVKKSNMIINGNVDDSFGSNSRDLKTKITGNVGPSFGFASYRLTAKIGGNLSSDFGYLSQDMFAITNNLLFISRGSHITETTLLKKHEEQFESRWKY